MKELVLKNKYCMVRVTLEADAITEEYFALDNGEETKVLWASGALGALRLFYEPDDGTRANAAMDYAAVSNELMKTCKAMHELRDKAPRPPSPCRPAPPAELVASTIEPLCCDGGQEICLRGEYRHGVVAEKRIRLGEEDTFTEVLVTIKADDDISAELLEDRLFFAPAGTPDFTWLPHMKYIEDNNSPDWTWKSPAAICQKDGLFAAIIPDLDYFCENKTLEAVNAVLDMDIRDTGAKYISIGRSPSFPQGHASFSRIAGIRFILGQEGTGYAYSVMPGSGAQSRQAYRPVAAFLWERYGRRRFYEGHAAQRYPFDVWDDKTWNGYADTVWQAFPYEGRACGSLMCPNWDIVGDAWFCAWWNNMRTAYGMELYSRRTGDGKAHGRAERILNLALAAPRNKGAFPVFFTRSEKGTYWLNDHVFGGYPDYYHHADMAWTAYWMLQWYKDFDPSNAEILARCVEYGELALAMQQDNGFIPSYFDADMNLRPDTGLNEESAEPAIVALFWTALYRATGGERYLRGAIKAMDYMQEVIVPTGKWFDFETFLSCAPKPYGFYDPCTGQQPQCTLAMLYVPMVFMELYGITRDSTYLENGCRSLDYLSMFQQVWSHPRLTPNLIGGICSQNTDSEWSDARQAICAPVYLQYYQVTGKKEYMERGVAALRASFAVAPAENWAHVGFLDAPGGVSGIHWGQGSAVVAAELLRGQYGDIYLDRGRQWGIGINGCTVESLRFEKGRIDIKAVTTFGFTEPILLKVAQPEQAGGQIIFNEVDRGIYSAEEQAAGIRIDWK